jgi:PAS domain S-box-containing protein
LTLAESTAGIGVWDLDLATNLVRGTPQFFRIAGLEPTVDAVPIERMRSLRHPNDRKRVLQSFASALATGKDVFESEYRIIRPDGAIRWIFGRGKLIRDRTGHPLRCAGVDIDITERKRAEEVAERLASIVESSNEAIVSKDLDGTIETWNHGATRLFGYAAEEVIGKPISILIPSDRLEEEHQIIDRIRRGDRVDSYETIRRRKNGSLVDISLTVSPIRDAAGKVIGASKIARDITDRKRAEDQRKLLLREMHHRTKNLFALVMGVVTLSARSATSPKEMVGALRRRLAALARAHELTMPSVAELEEKSYKSASLGELIQTIMVPHIDPKRPDRIQLSGPHVEVGGRSYTSVALLFHEFATNAAKYGALASEKGHVNIEWQINGNDVGLRWEERGGPAITGAPSSEGFGTKLAGATVVAQLGGQIERDWEPEGLTLRLVLPVEKLKQ